MIIIILITTMMMMITIINFIYIASISLTDLGALQKCIKTVKNLTTTYISMKNE